MEPILAFVVLLFVQFTHSVPVIPGEQCATTCNLDPQFLHFTPYKTYLYQVQTKTRINGGQEVQLEAKVEVAAHSQCDISLQLRETRFLGLDQQSALQLAQEIEEQPIQFGYDDGRVTSVCPSREDQLWAIDVKKAIISSLQMSSPSLLVRSQVLERDILGDCETTYQPMGRKYSFIQIRKSKQLNKCQNRQFAHTGLFPRAYATSSYQNVPFMNATFQCVQTLDKDLITASTCLETQELRGYGTRVDSELNLRFVSQSSGLSSRRVQYFLEGNNHLKMSSRSQYSTQDLTQILRHVCQHIESESHEHTVESFPQLVSSLATQDYQQIQRVAKAVQNNEICSSHQLYDLFLDASALSGSQGGAQVLLDQYQSGRVSRQRANYLFSLLAFTSSPDERAVRTLQPLLKSPDTPKHVILGISGLIHNLKQVYGKESASSAAIDALVERMENQRKDSSIVATIKALQNIGLESHQRARQYLWTKAQDSQQSESIRVAAIKALSDFMSSQESEQMVSLFRANNESNEVRINAYKAVVMSGVSRQQLQQIQEQTRRESNRDVQQFVRSHQKNLRESSDPHKKYVLPNNAPQFSEPQNQWFGISNNFESSFMFDALSLGVAFEADVIHAKDSQYIPRSIVVNFTVPAFGRELQLFEVEIRQKGFDSYFQQKIRNLKSRSGHSLAKQLIADAFDILSNADQWTNSVNSRDSQMQIHIKVDGKTILSVDSSDAKSDWQQMWNRLRQELDQRVDIDRAFAVQPINTRIQLPSTNGLPIYVRLNGTLVSSLKANLKVSDFSKNSNSAAIETQISPSFALQMEAGLEFGVKSEKKVIEVVSRVYSSPSWDSKTEIREKKVLNFKLNLNKEKQILVRAETQVYERDSRGQRVVSSGQRGYESSWCSETLKKASGLQVCQHVTPYLYELSLVKSDPTMKAYDFQVEQRDDNLRVHFNSPNSQVDRQLALELQVQRQSDVRQSLKVELRSPWIRYSVEGALRNEDKEQSVQLEVQRDGRKAFSLDLGLESQQRGQKREYRPRLRLQMSGQSEAIQMQGSVSVSKGRKNQLQIQLEGNQKQFLKGSFVREGERKSQDIRISSDLSANLPGIEARVTAVAEKSAKHAETDLTVEYRIRSQRKESLKVSWKVQNLTQSQLVKVSAFGELTSTQWPEANFHLAYNLLKKEKQQLENELTVAWTQQLSSKIHILHVSKLSQISANERKVENTLNVEITPLHVNYELRANADILGSDKPKYSAEVIGKDRTGDKQKDVRATFQYKHVSHAPLHLTLEANLKSSSRDMSYRDELVERSQGEYQGKTHVQWAKGQSADLQYEYKSKNNLHHEMDAELKMKDHVFKHSGMLKMSNNGYHVKSKLSDNDHQFYHVDSYVSRDQPNQLEAQTLGYALKVSTDPHSVPAKASFEFWTPNSQDYYHKSGFEYIPRTSVSLKSNTKTNNRQVLAVDAHVSRTTPSRFVVQSEPFDGRIDYSVDSGKVALSSRQQDWSHESQWDYAPQKYEFKSKTISSGKPVASIESTLRPFNGHKSFIHVEVPQHKSSFALQVQGGPERSGQLEIQRNQFKSKTNYDQNGQKTRLVSATRDQNGQIHSLDYQSVNGIHSLNSQLYNDYEIGFEGKPFSEEPYFAISGQKKSANFKTKARIARQNNKWILDSKNAKNSKNYDLSAQFSPYYEEESNVVLATPSIRASAKVTPSSQVSWQWEGPQVNHVSSGQWENGEYSGDSKTLWNSNYVNLVGKHSLKMTSFEAKSPLYDASFQLGGPKGKLALNSRHNSYPYSHVTEVSQTGNGYQVESRTDSQSEPVFSFGSQINRKPNPSTLEFQFGRQLKGKGKILAFGQNKRFDFEVNDPNYSHVSSLETNERSLALNSRTQNSNSKVVNKVDAYLSPRERSHVNVVHNQYSGKVELEPEQQEAKLEFQTPLWSHKSAFNANNAIRFESKTARNGQNFFDISSQVSPYSQNSYLNVLSPAISGQFSGNPEQRSAKIVVKSAEIDHNSELDFPSSFQSTTKYQNQVIGAIKVKNQNEKQLIVEIPHFVSQLNYGQNVAKIDYRSKIPNGRHVLASVGFHKGFHSDFAWDVDKDPNQRLVLDISATEEGNTWAKKRQVWALSAQYAGNDLKVISRMTSADLLRGPHALSVSFVPKYNSLRDSLSLEAKHEIRDNEMNCRLEVNESAKLKFGAKFSARLETGQQSGIQLSLETEAPENSELEMKVSFSERHSNLRQRNSQIFLQLKALKTSLAQQFLFETNLKRDNNQIHGTARVDTPRSGPQELEFSLEDWNRVKMWSSGASGKQLEFNANYELEHNKAGADLELKSNVRGIPSLALNGVIDGKQILVTFDVDLKRQLDFSVSRAGDSLSSGVTFEGRLETSFAPKVETKNALRVNSREIQISSELKVNSREISSLSLEANKSPEWSGRARYALNGAELAKANVESNFGGNQMNYILESQSARWQPIKVQFSQHVISSQEQKWSISATSGQQTYDVNTQWKRASGHVIPEKAFFSLSGNGHEIQVKSSFLEQLETSGQQESLLGLTSGQRIQNKIRNQFSVSVDSHALGFDVIQSYRSHGNDLWAKFQFPSNRQIQFKSDLTNEKSGSQNDVTAKSQLILNGEQPLVESTFKVQTNDQRISAQIQISSHKFQRSPKTASFFVERAQGKPWHSKLFLDLAKDKNAALTLETQVIDQSSTWSQHKNSSFSLALNSQDRQLDFSLSGHVSPQSAAVHYRNQNRRGDQNSGSFEVQRLPGNGNSDRYAAKYNDYQIDADFAPKSANFKLTNQRNGYISDVRLSADKECARVELKSTNQRQRYDLCAKFESRDKLFSLAVEEEGVKKAEFSLELDQRDQKALKTQLKWSPDWIHEQFRHFDNQWTQEVWQEFAHKFGVVARQLENSALEPFVSETLDLLQEVFGQFEGIESARQFFRQIFELIYSSFDWFVRNIENQLERIWRFARKQCKRSDLCFKALYALDNYGFESLADYVTNGLLQSAKRAHRVVMTSSQSIFQYFPSTPQWIQDFIQYYRQSISRAVNSVLDSNDDLRALATHLQTIGYQVTKSVDQVDWTQVQKAFHQIYEIIFSSQSFSRIMVWEPKRGFASLEIRSPAIESRSVRQLVRSVAQKDSSIKRMFFSNK